MCLLFCCFVQQPHTATPHALYSAPHPLFVSFRPPHTLHPLRCRALPLAASWGTTLRPILKYLYVCHRHSFDVGENLSPNYMLLWVCDFCLSHLSPALCRASPLVHCSGHDFASVGPCCVGLSTKWSLDGMERFRTQYAGRPACRFRALFEAAVNKAIFSEGKATWLHNEGRNA